jgi:hypothetical protein
MLTADVRTSVAGIAAGRNEVEELSYSFRVNTE